MIKLDWFIKLKMDVVLLCKCEEYLETIKKDVFINYPQSFSDENILSWNARVNEIVKINGKAMQSYIRYINLLEDTGKDFSKDNLLDEYNLIKENYVLCISYFFNILDYIDGLKKFQNKLDDHDRLARFSNSSTDYYNMIKINDDLLKKYRKEWRD